MPPAQTGSTIYQVPLSRTLIFSASSLYGFCSSAFPESLLLNRKSLPGNFRLRVQLKEAARLLKIPLWSGTFKTHFSCRQRAQGRTASFRRLKQKLQVISTDRQKNKGYEVTHGFFDFLHCLESRQKLLCAESD